ncbi:hypothetical protein FA13DRAFT_1714778 [Coprinellus micaceus]|uniref:Uncharacterized protein n=1 Tax=Coprinellus micaceus TaxID=71717 RepID=A0A4Y7SR17_COPMI|nr:hypothetical protein FA13DRAFT_1714778 [Coprinellus micaceus]
MDRTNDFIDSDSVADSSDASLYSNNGSVNSSPEIRAADIDAVRPIGRRVHFLDDPATEPVPVPPHRHFPIPSAGPTRNRLRQRRIERAARLDLLLPSRRDVQPSSQRAPSSSQQSQVQDEPSIPELPFPIYPLAPVPGEIQSTEAESARRDRLQRLRDAPHTALLWQRFHRLPPGVGASRVAMLRAALAGEAHPCAPVGSSGRRSAAQPNLGGFVAGADRVTPPPACATVDPRSRIGTSDAERVQEARRHLEDALATLRKAVQDLERARRVVAGRERGAL